MVQDSYNVPQQNCPHLSLHTRKISVVTSFYSICVQKFAKNFVGAELSAKNLKVFTANDKQYTQDNYYNLTLAKLPHKSEDGQLKSMTLYTY